MFLLFFPAVVPQMNHWSKEKLDPLIVRALSGVKVVELIFPCPDACLARAADSLADTKSLSQVWTSQPVSEDGAIEKKQQQQKNTRQVFFSTPKKKQLCVFFSNWRESTQIHFGQVFLLCWKSKVPQGIFALQVSSASS